MRNLTRYAAGLIAGIILTAGTGVVISGIAAQTEVDGIAVRQVIDMTANANGEATLTDLEIHPLRGLDLVIKLPEGATVAHKIEVTAKYDADSSDAPADGGKVDNAIGKVVDVRATPGDPTSAPAHRSTTLTQAEITAGEVDYIIVVSPNFGANTQNGLAIIDLQIQLST
ncbi:MAG: hypothetical protein OXR67_04640 [Chloroflexota bacterium]|nr:hypothetical protein [Chloroflexota bacterium]